MFVTLPLSLPKYLHLVAGPAPAKRTETKAQHIDSQARHVYIASANCHYHIFVHFVVIHVSLQSRLALFDPLA